ncbi:right-handed parallel beta-helix repeat-containing protein [Bacillus sp. ISL-57]|uniref:right-handed parallel beta-helix repeat-containing protein n=1 Tax=Bacillus sp. ISL-57 TaxID=2819135 RepID=UPI001BE60B4E|nr:right-handed parallel beta-helix repeat-containing protein [Bacillus sp. ISL-57]MBT2718083.1 hypothetical protein [Bacillus sp. ISL-57]
MTIDYGDIVDEPLEQFDVYYGSPKLNRTIQYLTDMVRGVNQVVLSIDQFPIQIPEIDDTGRLERASLFVSSKGGGKILLGANTYIARFYKIRDFVFLSGQGDSTILKLNDNTNTHFITYAINEGLRGGIENMTIDGNKQNNNNGDAIHLETPNWTGASQNPDIAPTIDKVTIRDAAGHGLHSGEKVREAKYTNIFVRDSRLNGFDIGGSDSILSKCTSFWNEGTGYRFFTGNYRISDLKAFGNREYGFWFNEATSIIGVNLEAQENYKHGVMLGGCQDITLTNVLADANGYSHEFIPVQPSNLNGVHIYDSKNIYVHGISNDFHKRIGEPGFQCYGVSIGGTSNENITIDMKVQFNYSNYAISGNNKKMRLDINELSHRDGIKAEFGTSSLTDESVISIHRTGKTRLKIGEYYDVGGNYSTIDSYNASGDWTGSLARIKSQTGDVAIGTSSKSLGFFGSYGTTKKTLSGANDTEKLNNLITILKGMGLFN